MESKHNYNSEKNKINIPRQSESRSFKFVLIGLLYLVLIYFIVGCTSSYFGWYGYKKWQYRVGANSIEEAKKRGVFVKELNFQMDSFPGTIKGFRPYIERGFRYGCHSSEETVILTDSNFPFQLSFNLHGTDQISLLMRKTELKKFDSSNVTQGYLRYPKLRDTITLDIIGESNLSGVVKVWQ